MCGYLYLCFFILRIPRISQWVFYIDFVRCNL